MASGIGVVIGIALGGATGAVARYGVSFLAGKIGEGFPWGTLTVNVLGCALMGALMALTVAHVADQDPLWKPSPALRAAVLVGFLGAFTTFSTYAWDAFDLAENGLVLRAGLYVVASNLVGLMALWAGYTLFVWVVE